MKESPAPQSIVVGIDGSKTAINAALWAVDEAVSRDIPLRLLYAIERDEGKQSPPDRAARKLAIAENAVRYAFTAVEAEDKPVKIEVEITQDRPTTALIRASASAAMVCVGAVGLHHFGPGRAGSTAAGLAVSAHCPVAVIRGSSHPSPRRGDWIVVEARSSSDDGILLGIAMEEARLRNSPLRAVVCGQPRYGDGNVCASPGGDNPIRPDLDVDRRLARWTRRYPDVRVESTAVHGKLLDYLAENGQSVQLIVVGARDREHLDELVRPSSNAVLQNAACSLLIVDRQHM